MLDISQGFASAVMPHAARTLIVLQRTVRDGTPSQSCAIITSLSFRATSWHLIKRALVFFIKAALLSHHVKGLIAGVNIQMIYCSFGLGKDQLSFLDGNSLPWRN